MKRIVAVLAVAVCLVLPGYAADRPTEATGSFAYQDNDSTGQQYALSFALDAPLGKLLQLGPTVRLTHADPEVGESVGVTSFGGTLTLNLTTSQNGLFIAASALYNTGDAEGYLLIPAIGVKFGGDGGLVRVALSKPYEYQNDETVDLETIAVEAGFGLRW